MGMGYFLGEKKLRTIRKQQAKSISHFNLPKINLQQHSLFVSILTEMGILTYIFFSYILIILFMNLYIHSKIATTFLTLILLALTQINAIHEIVLYLFFAYITKVYFPLLSRKTLCIKINPGFSHD